MDNKPEGSLKILVIGNTGVGKTTLLKHYINGKVDLETKATIGADFLRKKIEIDGRPVTLQIWDTAGQERFKSLSYSFYRGADACLLVYDITQASSFDDLDDWREQFIKHAEPNDPSTFPFATVANKSDMAEHRHISAKQGSTWSRKNGIALFEEVSAVEGDNIDNLFEKVVRAALEEANGSSDKTGGQFKLGVQSKKRIKKKDGCCN